MKELQSILIALNATSDLSFKYPIGNKELTVKVRELESNGAIKYNVMTGKWSKSCNEFSRILKRNKG